MKKSTLLASGWEVACPRWLVPPARLGFTRLEWLPAEVPGHVHVDLVRAGVIRDPFEALAELGSQWVDEERWSYRTTFELTKAPERPTRLLCFEGLDTVASVWLDGVKVAEHDDMFVPLEVNVSALDAGRHELRVNFEPATAVGRARRARYLAAEGLPENVVRFDERAFVRKAQYMYGWDWGPRLVSAGIWQPVTLVEHAGRLTEVHVAQTHEAGGAVKLGFESRFEGAGSVVHFVEGRAEPIANGGSLALAHPELWWPAGLGAQTLMTVTSYLVPERVDSRDAAERHALDRKVTRVGIRRVRLLMEPDEHGESFELEVNGRRVYALGANWIPDHSFPSLVTRPRLKAQLERARAMNMNMLRVWGGGLYESDDFYELSDALGLMVWQDFPFACQYYPEDAETLAKVREEATFHVRRLREHPSLVLWCGNNENLTMYESGWDAPDRHPPRLYGDAIYEGVLREVLGELDAERPYVPTSPWGGNNSNDGGIGDQHYWDVWHGRGDWKHYDDSTARFCSEFGFASAPLPACWRRAIPEAPNPLALDARDRRARFHDKTLKGYETFLGFVALHYPAPESLGAWSYQSILNQRDALRHGIEHFRRSELCRGALIWQLNDCWPVQSWAVVDSEGELKAAAFELTRLYAPALASLVLGEGRAELFVMLHNASTPFSGEAVLEATSLIDGRSLGRFGRVVTLEPDQKKLALCADLGAFPPETTLLTASFAGHRTHHLLCEPKDARPPTPKLRARAAEGGVVIESDTPVVNLFVRDPTDRVRFTRNFVTLPAPGTVELGTSGRPEALEARSLSGVQRVVVAGAGA